MARPSTTATPSQRSGRFAYGLFQGVAGFGAYAAVALVVWFGGRMVLDGALTMGELTSFLLYTLTIAFSLGALSGLWGDFMRAAGAAERVFELLDRTPQGQQGGEVLETVEGAVRFEDVHFAYPTRPDTPVLTGIDVDVAPGEVIALVGPSGAGKSTIASLLLRLYEPSEGQILLDGRPIHTLDPGALRRHIGVVQQEPVLFATSLADNIRYGLPSADDAAVRAAAEAAHAAEFIADFPEGYDTPVGERGVRLSGGQKQRVAIARALLKDPSLLVLDEATSALDAENEHLVQAALDRLMEGRTTFVIAHRLSTIRDADRVFVLDGGRVVEAGSHEDLLAEGGLYRRLVEASVRLVSRLARGLGEGPEQGEEEEEADEGERERRPELVGHVGEQHHGQGAELGEGEPVATEDPHGHEPDHRVVAVAVGADQQGEGDHRGRGLLQGQPTDGVGADQRADEPQAHRGPVEGGALEAAPQAAPRAHELHGVVVLRDLRDPPGPLARAEDGG